MAEAQSSSKRSGLTRAKAILIAVLAIALIAILYIQFGPSGAKLSSAPAGYRPPRRSASPRQASTTMNVSAKEAKTRGDQAITVAPVIDEARWKSPELATVIAYDPFALPAAFPQPPRVTTDTKGMGSEGLIASAAADDAKRLADAVEKLQMQLKELKERGVHVIVRERDQYAAMIGDRMLHVGDEINGFTVTAIDPTGVRVERKGSP